jgi:hypothetical protein
MVSTLIGEEYSIGQGSPKIAPNDFQVVFAIRFVT